MAAIALCGLLPQCTGGAPPPPTSTPAASSPRNAPEPAAVSPVTAAELGPTWHRDCPVTPAQLRRVSLTYLGFDDRPHRGELIVNQELVAQVIAVFDHLYRLEFPIERMQSVAHYRGGDDELSMEDNNTSAFNCRRIPGSGNWALHAYGRAIDVNPLLNPLVDHGRFEPRNAGVYLDRRRIEPGLLHAGDAAVRAFTDAGWRWGGNWKSPVDYQHFERR
ncbi:M15 family metallopeptidase [[Mycobacterium] holstebronense]|uniref:M15 family metallopeptidase n=1 Tax=[Mycobacterium] holstebronense TaxID=3064288 RepID=A0ABM9LQQ6_9MYCO|nr:M15 family metallopeptidase [Mycolicibacter sp. MU0102]CAJ1503064.1 M15 family metallopeptidase [Mycolicibacter sp. MU0102]